MRAMKPILIYLALTSVLAACSDDEVAEATGRARPVTTLTLETTSPGLDARVTGVAEPYREAQVGFEVGGRVEYVVDIGQEVSGAVLDENGALVRDSDGMAVREGDILAVLDTTRYRQATESTELKIASSNLGLESLRIELDEVLGADLAGAEAQLRAAILDIDAAASEVEAAQSAFDLAQTTVERDRQLVADGVLTQADLDQSQSGFDTAQARLAQANTAVDARRSARDGNGASVAKARGAIKLKEAQIETTKAEIAELELTLVQKQTDLDDCVLRAPFSGRVTEMHVSGGAYVRAGQTIVTLTLLDPIKISVSVSAENDRKVKVGSIVRIFVPGISKEVAPAGSLVGTVRTKSEVADARTRTFRLDVMVRNPRTPLAASGVESVSLEQTVPVVKKHAFEDGPLYVFPGCVTEDGYVLRLPGMNPRLREGPIPSTPVVPERVRVTFGDEYFNVIHWPFRRLADAGDLRPMDMLLIDPRPEHEAGVLLAGREWSIRPGELVPVALDLGEAPAGFYVPVHAIAERNGRTAVFVVDGDVVRETPVTAHEAYRDLRRIAGSGLTEGARIVVDGAHFLADGETVQVLGEATR